MELSAEVNKIFGQEMARLFADQISEDELKAKAEKVWNGLVRAESKPWQYGHTEPELERYIREEIVTRTLDKVKEILKEPESEEEIEKRVRQMVAKAREVAEEAIIRDLAHHLVDNTLSVYSRDEKIVQDVLHTMDVRAERGRGF